MARATLERASTSRKFFVYLFVGLSAFFKVDLKNLRHKKSAFIDIFYFFRYFIRSFQIAKMIILLIINFFFVNYIIACNTIIDFIKFKNV